MNDFVLPDGSRYYHLLSYGAGIVFGGLAIFFFILSKGGLT